MIYLDHAATTPVDSRVLEKMHPYFSDDFGNPSSLHSFGRKAKFALNESREKVTALLGVAERNIYFTGGGTESCNFALFGVVEADERKNKHVIISQIEHSAVFEAAEKLERKGVKVTYLPVNELGFVDLLELESAITEDTVLVSIIYANNEIGVVQNMEVIGEICREKNVLLHTDACQAAGYLDLSFDNLPVDLMSLNASKIYGPKGVGVLAARENVELSAQIVGGGQEFGLRSGTENVPGIVGMAAALELAYSEMAETSGKIKKWRDYLLDGLLAEIEDCYLIGDREARLVNNINLIIGGCEGESLLLRLDQAGIAASSGSACSSGSLEPSHVLTAIGLSRNDSHSSLRLTLGKTNNQAQIEEALKIIVKEVKELREI